MQIEESRIINKAKQLEEKSVLMNVTSLVNELEELSHYVNVLKHEVDKVGFTVFNRHIDHHLHEFNSEDNGTIGLDVASWWVVDDFFAKLLRDKGEVIIESSFFTVWGRSSGGQMIHCDAVVQEVAEDLIRKYS